MHKSSIPGGGGVITELVPSKAVGLTVGSNHVTFPLKKIPESLDKLQYEHNMSCHCARANFLAPEVARRSCSQYNVIGRVDQNVHQFPIENLR